MKMFKCRAFFQKYNKGRRVSKCLDTLTKSPNYSKTTTRKDSHYPNIQYNCHCTFHSFFHSFPLPCSNGASDFMSL